MSDESREMSDLYIRGVTEASRGKGIRAQDILDVLSVFGEDGVRAYMLGVLEGIDELNDWEDELTKLAYVVHEANISILDEDENCLEVWIEKCAPDLRADGSTDLHIVNDSEEVIISGEIVMIEFKSSDPNDLRKPKPAKVFVEKDRFEIVEYEKPWNPLDNQ